jgi:fluoroacetyl-CoA thioesterase
MKDSLKPGIEHQFDYVIAKSKIVSALFPESAEFQTMPEVFATGFLVGLIEWVCVQAVNPHIDWPSEQTVGTLININHIAASPPGTNLTVKVKLRKVEGRKLAYDVAVWDEAEKISEGTHERYVINAQKFAEKALRKLEKIKRKDSLTSGDAGRNWSFDTV